MKILMVSNLYPPFYHGGYEVRCAQVAEALQRAGHEVRVLTSVYGLPVKLGTRYQRITEMIHGVRVDRWLHNDAFGPQQSFRPWVVFQIRRELIDARRFVRVLSEFRPDVINWWNMNGISKLLLPLPERWNIPDVHWIEYPWMVDEYGACGEKASRFWKQVWDGAWGPPVVRPLLRCLAQRWESRIKKEGFPTREFPNRPTLLCFVSDYLRRLYRESGLDFPCSQVQFGGVPVEPFYRPVVEKAPTSDAIRILYAGQLTADRGLHIAVEALGQMAAPYQQRVRLSVAGPMDGAYRSYYERVARRVEELGLSKNVTFLGKVDHDRMPEIYKSHHLLVFLSTREEGLPLVMVEAMLAGCAVVTTGSGGAMEIAELADLPVVSKGDSLELAKKLEGLIGQPETLRKLAARGQAIALREFSLDRMIGRWQDTLQKLCKQGRGQTGEQLN
jgi:glycosyltransferase involved in cell wall biosynthesis